MKKRMSIALVALLALVSSACGSENNAVNAPISEVASTNEVSPTTEVETEVKTSVSEPVVETITEGYNDLVDWVIGEDIAVVERPDMNHMVKNLPPISIKLPAKDFADTVAYDNGDTGYYISVPGTELFVEVGAFITSVSNDHCVGTYHKEYIECGRYTMDIGNHFEYDDTTTYTAIADNEVGMTINILLELSDANHAFSTLSTEDIAAYRDFVTANVEYIKEQVASWDGSYVAPEPTIAESTEEPASEDTDPLVDEDVTIYSKDDGKITIEIIDIFTDNAKLVANDYLNHDRYECDLVPMADNYYHAIYNGEMIFEVEISLSGLYIDTQYEEYANFYGDYTE